MDIIKILTENGYRTEESYINDSTLYGEFYYKFINNSGIKVVLKKYLNIYTIEFYNDNKYEYLYIYDNQTTSSIKEIITNYHKEITRDICIGKLIQN